MTELEQYVDELLIESVRKRAAEIVKEEKQAMDQAKEQIQKQAAEEVAKATKQINEKAEKRVGLAMKKIEAAEANRIHLQNTFALYLLKKQGASLSEISGITGLNPEELKTLQKQLPSPAAAESAEK